AGELLRGVADGELFADHMELQLLNEILSRPATGSFGVAERGIEAADNLVAYLGRVTSTLEQADLEDLLVIWEAAFTGAEARRTTLFSALSP
ncbi:MAG: hypothetical protein WDZ54_07260, partial [Sneathiella sp.]